MWIEISFVSTKSHTKSNLVYSIGYRKNAHAGRGVILMLAGGVQWKNEKGRTSQSNVGRVSSLWFQLGVTLDPSADPPKLPAQTYWPSTSAFFIHLIYPFHFHCKISINFLYYRQIGDASVTCKCPPGFKGKKCQLSEEPSSKYKIYLYSL